MNNKIEKHKELCLALNKTYERKNNDYGDSFAKLRQEFPNAILVRLADKFGRIKSLLTGTKQQVSDESIKDTLLDLANYCIMEVVEMECEAENEEPTIETAVLECMNLGQGIIEEYIHLKDNERGVQFTHKDLSIHQLIDILKTVGVDVNLELGVIKIERN